MTRFDPSNIARAKRTFVTNPHFACGHDIDRVIGVPVLICVKVRRKFCLNEKGPVIV
jgi:hypothetical protein